MIQQGAKNEKEDIFHFSPPFLGGKEPALECVTMCGSVHLVVYGVTKEGVCVVDLYLKPRLIVSHSHTPTTPGHNQL